MKPHLTFNWYGGKQITIIFVLPYPLNIFPLLLEPIFQQSDLIVFLVCIKNLQYLQKELL